MPNIGCDHIGQRVYARKRAASGAIQYCVQCKRCKHVCKLPQHNNRPWIRHDEIPAGRAIEEFLWGDYTV